jgi:hypothetical protein
MQVAGCEISIEPDGVLRCVFLDVARDDLGAVRDFMRAIVRSGGGPGTPVLVEIDRLPSEAQAERLVYLASTEAAALAIVAPQTRLRGALAALASAQCPARAFTDRSAAQVWLREYTPAGG